MVSNSKGESIMKRTLPRNFAYSTSEYVIKYQSPSGPGVIIIDCNYYDKINKILQSKLKGCQILEWYQRPKAEQI